MSLVTKIKGKVNNDDSSSVAVMQLALKTRTLFGLPFHLIDIAVAISLLVGSFFFESFLLSLLCVIIAIYFIWGAWIDYYKYREACSKK